MSTEGISQVAYNIIGGFIIGGLTLIGHWFYRQLHAWKFKQIFRDEENDNFHIIYKSMKSPREAVFPEEESKIPRETSATTNLSLINSCAETRGVSYLVFAFGHNLKKAPEIISHTDLDRKINLSFISIGGPTNHRTKDLLENDANKLLDYKHGKIIEKTTERVLIQVGDEPGFDYGFIIKIHPTNFPLRSWICCGGFGEWGTSGSSWYLAHKWNDIRKLAGQKEFACITKTRIGCDEDTHLLGQFHNRKEIERFTKYDHRKNVITSSVKTGPFSTLTTTTTISRGNNKKGYCTELPPEHTPPT
jgi:hypothetical protein